MGNRRFDTISMLLLLAMLSATAFSGLLADYLGLPRSLYHRVSAYSLAALASWHIILRRRQLWARFKTAGRSGMAAPSPPQPGKPGPGPARGPALSRRGFLLSSAVAAAGFYLGRWLPLGRPSPELEGTDLGLAYHEWSKPDLWGVVRKPFQWGGQPPLYKEYPAAPRVVLPPGSTRRGLSLEEAVRQRRSIRDYSGDPLTLEQLSLLLQSAYGITEPSYPLRASPSAGALYPLEVYPVVNGVAGMAAGVYHYRPGDHSLETIKEGDFRSSLLAYTGGQDMVLRAGVVMVITAFFQRTRWKYQDRAYRYVLLDAGHLGENLYLAATSLGLGPCGIGAFLDDEMNGLVGIDGREEAVLYLVSIGRPVA